MRQLYLVSIFYLAFVQVHAQPKLVLGDAQVAPNNQSFAFSATSTTAFRVYEQQLSAAGARAERISPEAPGFHCYAPAYSSDGHYLLYLKAPAVKSKKQHFADLMLYDRQTKTVTQLTTGQQAITQALFSADGKRIIYCAAGFYGSYSPIGPKAEHELDIFSVSLDGSARAQHTRLKAYFMGDLRLFKAPATYLVNVNDPRQNLSGTYVLSLDAPEQLQLVSDEAVAARGLSYMPRFTVSAQGQVAFAIGNELFIKNMKTGRSEVVQIAIPLADPRPTAFVGETTMLIYERFPATSPKEEPSFQFSLLNLSNLSKTIIPLRTE